MNSVILAVTDIETTGLSQESGHRIIEIAIAIARLQYDSDDKFIGFEKIGATWNQRINPLRPIDPAAEAVHGISLADLATAPTWDEVAPKVSKIFSKVNVGIAHNAAFDMPFIALELLRVNQPLPKFEVFCTMDNGRSASPLGAIPSLQDLCWTLGVGYDPSAAHAASYDVDCTVEALKRMLKLGYIKPSQLLGDKAPTEVAA